ncbi:hypothetical protein ABZ342_26585 [Amycolatopsis sp. NPDC005961]|uniref:hypothetical protein n=1 Tax=Amycolatopsis sp. NPDC005961 TaxID=3156720 RepID=UPI0033CA2749
MSEMLGVPPEDHGVFHTWTSDIGLVFSLAHGGDVVARVESALVGLNGYIDSLMVRRRTAPEGDLLSALVAARRDDPLISPDEVRNLMSPWCSPHTTRLVTSSRTRWSRSPATRSSGACWAAGPNWRTRPSPK